MPSNKFEGRIYALITVLITVPCFVIYCLSYESGGILNINLLNVLIFIPIEFVLAYASEIFLGSPLSIKLALKAVNPKETHPMIFETAIICATVVIMCTWMTFLATIIYTGIIPGIIYYQVSLSTFLINFIPNYLQTLVFNFPFALLSQLFFIQPLTRRIFRRIFKKQVNV